MYEKCECIILKMKFDYLKNNKRSSGCKTKLAEDKKQRRCKNENMPNNRRKKNCYLSAMLLLPDATCNWWIGGIEP
jgi:hypothetical protein